MGVGMSASTGYRPFIPLLVISIGSRLGFIEVVQNIELMNSNLFLFITYQTIKKLKSLKDKKFSKATI